MQAGVFVLIMVFGGGTSQSGYTSVQQEFGSFEKCEYARKELEKAHEQSGRILVHAQGCFRR